MNLFRQLQRRLGFANAATQATILASLNTLTRDVGEIKSNMATKEDIAFLHTVFPEAVAASCPRCALPSGMPFASQFGDTATWSLLRHDNILFAVGCAHCAFSFSTLLSTGGTVANIPPCLISHVQGLLVLPGYLSAFPPSTSLVLSGLPTEYDFVAFELKSTFPAGELAPVDWPSSVQLGSRGVVTGVAHSGNVMGDRLHWVGDKYLGFVERRGEPGNSGTLMFAPDKSRRLHVLGVYCGVEPQMPRMSFRGRICPLPPFHALQRYEVRRPEEGEEVSLYSRGAHALTVHQDCIQDTDGAVCPIVIVCDGENKLPKYCGTVDSGYCRSIYSTT